MVFKKYPERIDPEWDNTLNEVCGVCICSHGDFSHERDKNKGRGQCRNCLCEEYKLEIKMTLKEISELNIKESLANASQRSSI